KSCMLCGRNLYAFIDVNVYALVYHSQLRAEVFHNTNMNVCIVRSEGITNELMRFTMFCMLESILD
ncbi:hypothetical protein, partial [Desulfosporosinus nitroreducens]|uniref:hypothetical protein n=1 Tax=Desulfosporosinus nitroreducens TaxID=2018668 RepID=UPI00207D5904